MKARTLTKHLEDFSVHKLLMLGIAAGISLTIFLFQLSWNEILSIGEDVTIVRESVARIEGRIDSWYSEQMVSEP